MKKVVALMAALSVSVSPVFASVPDAAEAANVLSSISGVIKVKQGGRIVAASDGMKLRDGDIVTVVGKGSARIAYGKTCTVTLAPRSSTVIGPDLCLGAEDPSQITIGSTTPAAAAGAGAGSTGTATGTGAAAAGTAAGTGAAATGAVAGIATTTIVAGVVGTVVVAGVVTGVVSAVNSSNKDNNNNNPASN